MPPPWKFKQLDSQLHYSQALQNCRNLDPYTQPEPAFNKFYKWAPACWSLRSTELGGVEKPAEKNPMDSFSTISGAELPNNLNCSTEKNPIFPILSHPITAESLYESRLALPWLAGGNNLLDEFLYQTPTGKTFEESIRQVQRDYSLLFLIMKDIIAEVYPHFQPRCQEAILTFSNLVKLFPNKWPNFGPFYRPNIPFPICTAKSLQYRVRLCAAP